MDDMADPLGLIGNTTITPTTTRSPNAPRADAAGVGGPSFKDVLMENIQQVNRLQRDAETAIEDLHTGKRTDVDQVLIAKQKADLAFQTLLQVRNKLVAAYEELKQMRV
jgi:flagellar hook-basal body complex protein FliE